MIDEIWLFHFFLTKGVDSAFSLWYSTNGFRVVTLIRQGLNYPVFCIWMVWAFFVSIELLVKDG